MSGAVDTELMREPGLEPMVQAPNESGHRRTHHEIAGPGKQDQLDCGSVSRTSIRGNREEIVESDDVDQRRVLEQDYCLRQQQWRRRP